MARPQSSEMYAESAGSWLGAVTSIVGILVVLVMLAGARAKPAIAPPVDTISPAERELASAKSSAVSVERDVHEVERQAQIVEAEMIARGSERLQLASLLSAAEQVIARKRGELDSAARRQYELERDLALAKRDLELAELEGSGPKTAQVVKVESVPTPLSRTVDGREVHLQLKGNYVVIVPMDELTSRLKEHAQERLWKLRDAQTMTDSLGPIEGFRMRYMLERVDVSLETTVNTGRAGSYIRLVRYELLPVTSQLGDPIDEALAPDSAFRRRLALLAPPGHTITIWAYDDSFDAFRRLRKDLYEHGYPVAGRPLPEGLPISGSPQGSKSAAE